MITTGIVREVNLSGEGHTGNLYRVELPFLRTAADPDNEVVILPCTACLPGGIYDCYSIGDYVYVGFVNNKFNFPVILGRIYQGLEKESGSYLTPATLKVIDRTELSRNTQIGALSYDDLLYINVLTENFQDLTQYNNQNQDWVDVTVKGSSINDGTTELKRTESTIIGKWVDENNLYRIVYRWKGSIAANTSFSIIFDLPDVNIDYCWWDNGKSCIKGIGQPYYKTTTDNIRLTMNLSDNDLIVSGRVEGQSITEFTATLLYTTVTSTN